MPSPIALRARDPEHQARVRAKRLAVEASNRQVRQLQRELDADERPLPTFEEFRQGLAAQWADVRRRRGEHPNRQRRRARVGRAGRPIARRRRGTRLRRTPRRRTRAPSDSSDPSGDPEPPGTPGGGPRRVKLALDDWLTRSLRPYTFATHRELYGRLSPSDQLVAFLRLPQQQRHEAWDELAAALDRERGPPDAPGAPVSAG
jgi:hypothetical protein